jgi:hypothetical protein
MDYFVIPVETLLSAKLFGKISFLKKYYERYQQSVLKKYLVTEKGIHHSAEIDDFATVYRNADYLQYKTYSQTEVIKTGDTKVWISANEKNFSDTIEQLKRIAGKTGATEIQFHCSPGTRLHNLFSAYFKASPSYPALFQDFDSPVPPEKIKFTFADIDIF